MVKTILILGATSPSGIFTVRELLHTGNRAVLYVRNPSKLPQDIATHEAIKVITGSISDEHTLDSVFTHEVIDAVLSLVGPPFTLPWNSATDLSDLQMLLVKLMRKHGVRRILSMGTISIYDPQDNPSLGRSAMVWGIYLLVHSAWREIIATSNFFQGVSDIDWVLFRLPRLTGFPTAEEDFETASTDGLRVGYVGDGSGLTLQRNQLGKWLAVEVTKEGSEWVRKMPSLSSVAIEKKAV